jgi:Ras-related protein Rab-2A
VYDITKRETFENISRWLEEAKQNGNPKLTFTLVGNKSDLEAEYGKIYSLVDKFLLKKVKNLQKLMA